MNGLKLKRLIPGKEKHLDVTDLENGSYLIAVHCNQKISVKPFIKK
jgi:hypothetical protein